MIDAAPVILWLLCAGNGEDDDVVENDGVFHIPDAVFGSAGCHTVGASVNGKFIILWCHLLMVHSSYKCGRAKEVEHSAFMSNGKWSL